MSENVLGAYFRFGQLLMDYPLFSRFSAAMALFLEVGCIILIFYDRLKWVFVPALMLMHVMIAMTLNIWFQDHLFILLLFFDWHCLIDRVRTLLAGTRFAVLARVD